MCIRPSLKNFKEVDMMTDQEMGTIRSRSITDSTHIGSLIHITVCDEFKRFKRAYKYMQQIRVGGLQWC